MNRIYSGEVEYKGNKYLYIYHKSLDKSKVEVFDFDTIDMDTIETKIPQPSYSSYKDIKSDNYREYEYKVDIEPSEIHNILSSILKNKKGRCIDSISENGITKTYELKEGKLVYNELGTLLSIEIDGKVEVDIGKYENIKCDIQSYETTYIPKRTKGIKYVNKGIRYTTEVAVLNSLRTIGEVKQFKNLRWLKDKDYKIIKTVKEFLEVIRILRDLPKGHLVGIDVETTGLEFNSYPIGHRYKDELVGIVLSWEDNQGVYIPVGHRFIENIDIDLVLKELKPLINKGSDELLTLCTHNGKFDWKVFHAYGIDLYVTHDSFILKYLLDNRVTKVRMSLEALAEFEMGIEMVNLKDFFKVKGINIDFSYLTEDRVQGYAPADGDITRQLTKMYLKILPRKMLHLYSIEIMLMRCLGHTEYYGTRLDLKVVKEQEDELVNKIEEMRMDIFKYIQDTVPKDYINLIEDCIDIDGNLDKDRVMASKLLTGKKLGTLLFEAYKMPNQGFTATGAYKVDKFALEKLSKVYNEDGSVKYPLVEKLRDLNKFNTQNSGFFQSMKDVLKEDNIFTNFRQTGTESGRLSATKPNLQVQDNKVKSNFIPHEDYYFLDADFSQIEYRVMASLSREIAMIKILSDPEADFHTEVASMLLGKPPHMVTSEDREAAKALNFGIPYGMGGKSLAYGIHKKINDETIADGFAKIELYFNTYQNIDSFFRQSKQNILNTLHREGEGYVETHLNRKRILIDGVFKNDNEKIGKAMLQAGNTRIQGTAADIFKQAYVRYYHLLEQEGLLEIHPETKKPLVWVVGNIHDEVLVSVHKSVNPYRISAITKMAMEFPIEGFCPLYAGIGIGENWHDAKEGMDIPIRLSNRILKQYMETCKNKVVEYKDNEFEEITKDEYLDFYNPIDNPVKSVKNRILNFQEQNVFKHIEELGFDLTNTEENPIELEKVFNVYNDYRKRFWITKYTGKHIKDKNQNNKFVRGLAELFDKRKIKYTNNCVFDEGDNINYEDEEKVNEEDIDLIYIEDEIITNSKAEELEKDDTELGFEGFITQSGFTYIIDCRKVNVEQAREIVNHIKDKTNERGMYKVKIITPKEEKLIDSKVISLSRNKVNEILSSRSRG